TETLVNAPTLTTRSLPRGMGSQSRRSPMQVLSLTTKNMLQRLLSALNLSLKSSTPIACCTVIEAVPLRSQGFYRTMYASLKDSYIFIKQPSMNDGFFKRANFRTNSTVFFGTPRRDSTSLRQTVIFLSKRLKYLMARYRPGTPSLLEIFVSLGRFL